MGSGCLKNSPSPQMTKIRVTENVLRLEKVAYKASWRNFKFANFAGKSLSTATGFITDRVSMHVGECDKIRNQWLNALFVSSSIFPGELPHCSAIIEYNTFTETLADA